ncbi:MAG TPA: hypothetical protein VKA68_07860 [bacterium]|nr:hypothetical protein [bacterium]
MPKIPAVKPLLLIPHTRRMQARKVLTLLIDNVSGHVLAVLILALLSALNLNMLSLAGLVLLYLSYLIAGWQWGVGWRFGRTDPGLFVVYGVSILNLLGIATLFAAPGMPVLFAGAALCLLGLTVTSFYKNAESLLRTAFEKSEMALYRHFPKPRRGVFPYVYLIKELRMGLRSRRLRHIYYLGIPYFIFMLVFILFIPDNRLHDGYVYFICIATPMGVFNEYFEKFWRWDDTGTGLIYSFPIGRKAYFIQRMVYAFILGSMTLVLHLLLRDPSISIIRSLAAGVILMVGLPVLAGYSGVTDRNINAELSASIWNLRKNPATIRFAASLVFLLILNRYFLLAPPLQNGAGLMLSGVYLLAISGMLSWVLLRSYRRIRSLEWRM